jgi:hypothetical protein
MERDVHPELSQHSVCHQYADDWHIRCCVLPGQNLDPSKVGALTTMITNPQEMGRQMLAEDSGAVPPGATEPTGAQSKRWVDQAEAKAASGDRLGGNPRFGAGVDRGTQLLVRAANFGKPAHG